MSLDDIENADIWFIPVSRNPMMACFIWRHNGTLTAYHERPVLSLGNTIVCGNYQENNVYRKDSLSWEGKG